MKINTSRVSWKDIMDGSLVKGPDYWSNGHFLLLDDIEMPKYVATSKNLHERKVTAEIYTLMRDSDKMTVSNPEAWLIDYDKGLVIAEEDICFDLRYINAISKLVPGFTLLLADKVSAAAIKKDGKVVGCLMPYRNNPTKEN